MDRKSRLQQLINERFKGSQAEFARAIKRSPAQVNQWLSTRRMIGDAGVRHIEMSLGLSAGWMDGKKFNISVYDNVSSKKIPLISYAQASRFTEELSVGQLDDINEWMLADIHLSDSAFALQIKEDSMSPEFKDGDMVIIDPKISPIPGDFVVAKDGNKEVIFRRYRLHSFNAQKEEVIELVPINSDYPYVRSDILPLKIIGTMIEHRKYRKK